MKSIPKANGTYPNKLDDMRKELGWTKVKLAEELYGWKSNHIHDLIHGRRKPSDKTKERVVEVFGVNWQEVWIEPENLS